MSRMIQHALSLNAPPHDEVWGWFGYFYFYARHTGDPSLPAGGSR